MAYQNTTRSGIRSSVTANPRIMAEDVSQKLNIHNASRLPIQAISKVLGRGAKPKNHKIAIAEYYKRDIFDYTSDVTIDTAGGGYQRFAKIKLNQSFSPEISEVIYQPQDQFTVTATGQAVEVVMTPTAAFNPMGVGEITLPTSLTGNTTTRCAAGYVIVRAVASEAILPFTQSSMLFRGRTIVESQKIEATSFQSDIRYKSNFVEHKEAVLEFTEPQKKWLETVNGVRPDWEFHQERTMETFQETVEATLWFGQKAADYTLAKRPKRTLEGIIPSIRTNVAYYNPTTTSDFELLVISFINEQAYKYDNTSRKMGWAGQGFLTNFNLAFREYRRINQVEGQLRKIGLNYSTYDFMGKTIDFAECGTFRPDTEYTDWLAVFDPSKIDLRLVKNYETKTYHNADDRDWKLMMEWEGTIAFNEEQHAALLRT